MLFLLLGLGASQAASRMVIDSRQPIVLYVDGLTFRPLVGSTRIEVGHILAGNHTFVVKSESGQQLYNNQMDVPDKALVHAVWEDWGSLTVVAVMDLGAQAPPEPNFGQGKIQADQGQGSRDSSGSNSSSSTPYAGYDGTDRLRTVGQVAVRTAPVAVSLVSPTAGALTAIGSTTYQTVRSNAQQAEAGGAGFSSAAYDPNARQGNPTSTAPPPSTEVTFHYGGGFDTLLYVDEVERSLMTAAMPWAVLDLTVGTHVVLITKADGGAQVYKGNLRVEEGAPITLTYSATSRPQVEDRTWAWTDQ